MKTKDIKQKVTFQVSPAEVYKALMDSKIHSAFTSSVCKIGKKEGSSYSAYDGYINGKNVKLIPGKKITQTWQAVDGVWPEGYYSEITFDLKAIKNGTELNFLHKGVPINQLDEFKKGWVEHYWEPMKDYFKKED